MLRKLAVLVMCDRSVGIVVVRRTDDSKLPTIVIHSSCFGFKWTLGFLANQRLFSIDYSIVRLATLDALKVSDSNLTAIIAFTVASNDRIAIRFRMILNTRQELFIV